jgi:uncharacterized protein (UPF0261 family)
MKKTVLLIITLDTKWEEASYLKKTIEDQGLKVLVMDAGVFPAPSMKGDIKREEVAAAGGQDMETLVESKDKGKAIRTMIAGAALLTKSLYERRKIDGVLSVGGAQGTIIGTTAMKSLPIGAPKLMVSTVASGKRIFETYVDTSDITLMHSVVDFFGFNTILKRVLTNAAGAISGMVKMGRVPPGQKPKVAITIYGTTTPAGMSIVSLLQEAGYEVVAFHPNGTGGMAMERMIREGRIAGVIDLTTHELVDELAGGGHACGPHRLEAASDMKIPQVVIPGSIDYIVQGRFETLRASFRRRKTMMHNPEMTFVKTSVREMAELGRIIARKLNRSHGNTMVMIPLEGFSFPNHRGRVFYDPKGVKAFLKALKEEIGRRVPVRALPYHINDGGFAEEVVAEFQRMMAEHRSGAAAPRRSPPDLFQRCKF